MVGNTHYGYLLDLRQQGEHKAKGRRARNGVRTVLRRHLERVPLGKHKHCLPIEAFHQQQRRQQQQQQISSLLRRASFC